jgi:hypothetical protein
MDENTLKNLQALEQLFQYTCQACDPLDYEIRQRNLLYTLVNFCLVPLVNHREEEKKRVEAEAAALATTTQDITIPVDPPVTDEVKNAVEAV